MTIQELITKHLGNSPVTYMVAGIAILIIINLILAIWLANKSKTDSIKFELLPDFITPTLTHSIFLITMQVLVLSTKDLPLFSSAFTGFQIFGFITVLVKYFTQIYTKLKQLGMPVDPKIDEQIIGRVDDILGTARGGTPPAPAEQPASEEVPAYYSPTEDQVINEGRPKEDERG